MATRIYKGERVEVRDEIGGLVEIWIPSEQRSCWVKPEVLEEEVSEGQSGSQEGGEDGENQRAR